MRLRATTYKSGATFWDADLLPAAEFRKRASAVQTALADAGVAALLCFGNADRYQAGCYLSGLRDVAVTPYAPLGPTIVLRAEGDPVALCPGPDAWRYERFTWLAVEAAGALHALPSALARLLPPDGRLATTGLDATVPAALIRPLRAALGGRTLVPFDRELAAIMDVKRPREIEALQTAADVLSGARSAAEEALRSGASPRAAYARARAVAHAAGGHDVCGNAGAGDGVVVPCEELVEGGARMHLALEYQGYWAHTALDLTPGDTAARQAVAAMVRAARPGATAASVAAAALAELPAEAVYAALEYGLGSGLGLGHDEDPVITPGSDAVLQSGSVLALHVFDAAPGGAGVAAATVAVASDGAARPTLIARP